MSNSPLQDQDPKLQEILYPDPNIMLIRNPAKILHYECLDDICLVFQSDSEELTQYYEQGSSEGQEGEQTPKQNHLIPGTVWFNLSREGFEGKGAKQMKTLLSLCQCCKSGSRSSTSVINFPPGSGSVILIQGFGFGSRSVPFIKISKKILIERSLFLLFNDLLWYGTSTYQTNIFFNGHNNVQVGSGSGWIHILLASRICNSGFQLADTDLKEIFADSQYFLKPSSLSETGHDGT